MAEHPHEPSDIPTFVARGIERSKPSGTDLDIEASERYILDELDLAFNAFDELPTPHPTIPFYVSRNPTAQHDLHFAGFLDGPLSSPVLDFRASPPIYEFTVGDRTVDEFAVGDKAFDVFAIEARIRHRERKPLKKMANYEADLPDGNVYRDQQTLKRIWCLGALARSTHELFNPELVTLSDISHMVVRSATRTHQVYALETTRHSGIVEQIADVDRDDGQTVVSQVGISPGLKGRHITKLKPLPFDDERSSIIAALVDLQHIATHYDEDQPTLAARRSAQMIDGSTIHEIEAQAGRGLRNGFTQAIRRLRST